MTYKRAAIVAAGFAALGIACAPTAFADTDDLTNAEVAAAAEQTAAVDPTLAPPWLADTGGGGTAYWMAVLDPQWKAYTDAEGRIIQRCVTNACGDDMGTTRVSPNVCDTAPVNEPPKAEPSDGESEDA